MNDTDLYIKILLQKCSRALPKTELQINFRVNWVFTQPDLPQLRTCKINCVFLFFLPHVFCGYKKMSAMFFLLNEAIGNLPAYLFTHIICLSSASN